MENVKPITSLLIANRGEIARRINKTAQSLGIGTVAIYADGDAEAPFVREAKTAIALDGRTSAETYLDIGKVLDACRRSGADALHPGYGFLSENEGFAQAVIDAGLAWLGPSPEVIAAMGDKLAAKQLMTEAGVPTLPAIEITDDLDINAAAEQIGYPVLIKASAGGGGRGMRVVTQATDLADAIASARREAGSAFADDTVFLEKWLDQSRHVEIQIIGDKHGNLVHCFERECSIQRRHQKIIEEAPSPAMTEAVRAAMCEAAIKAAQKLGYSSAGTVEFLLAGEDFYFLEVNARLQVEHPVTEAIIGHDLVREQIRIAEGERLSFTQGDLAINGFAIEARLCAENPDRDFLPSPGPVTIWAPAAGARFDSGVESGSVISPDFDPMIAKVIVHAPSRREAASRLATVLENTQIQGLKTNRDFLVSCLRHEAFLAGDTTTDFIDRVKPARVRSIADASLENACIAVAMESQALNRAGARVLKHIPSGWRNSVMPFEVMRFCLEAGSSDRYCHVAYRGQRDGSFMVKVACSNSIEELDEKDFSRLLPECESVDAGSIEASKAGTAAAGAASGKAANAGTQTAATQSGNSEKAGNETLEVAATCRVIARQSGSGQIDMDKDGQRHYYTVTRSSTGPATARLNQWLVHGAGGDLALTELPRYPVPGADEAAGSLTAPMPGAVLAIEVKPGDTVSKGDLLLILEAMKMEHRIIAPADGQVEGLHAGIGEQVENGQLLVTLNTSVDA